MSIRQKYKKHALPRKAAAVLFDDFTYVHAYVKLYPYEEFIYAPCNKGLL